MPRYDYSDFDTRAPQNASKAFVEAEREREYKRQLSARVRQQVRDELAEETKAPEPSNIGGTIVGILKVVFVYVPFAAFAFWILKGVLITSMGM